MHMHTHTGTDIFTKCMYAYGTIALHRAIFVKQKLHACTYAVLLCTLEEGANRSCILCQGEQVLVASFVS